VSRPGTIDRQLFGAVLHAGFHQSKLWAEAAGVRELVRSDPDIVDSGRNWADAPSLRGTIDTDLEPSVIEVALFEGAWSMRDFACPNCGQHLAFENSVCLSCGGALGFSLDERALLIIATGLGSEHDGTVDASRYQLCTNLHVAECNWLVKIDSTVGLPQRALSRL